MKEQLHVAGPFFKSASEKSQWSKTQHPAHPLAQYPVPQFPPNLTSPVPGEVYLRGFGERRWAPLGDSILGSVMPRSSGRILAYLRKGCRESKGREADRVRRRASYILNIQNLHLFFFCICILQQCQQREHLREWYDNLIILNRLALCKAADIAAWPCTCWVSMCVYVCSYSHSADLSLSNKIMNERSYS